MKRKQGSRKPPRSVDPANASGLAQKIAAASTTMIFALQSSALATPSGPQQPTAFECTNAGYCFPLLEPGTLVALGATVATIGVYRLRKAREHGGSSKNEGTAV
jgi:hypothetical protein